MPEHTTLPAVATQVAEKATQTASGVFAGAKGLWGSFSLEKWTNDMGGSSATWLRAGVWLSTGFAVGYLFRKYFTFLVCAVISAIIMVKWLEYQQILTIEWTSLKTIIGVDAAADINQNIMAVFGWIKANMVMFIAVVGGFLLGYRLG